MSNSNLPHKQKKSELHPRNKNRAQYNFKKLCGLNPDLAGYLIENKNLGTTIEFANPGAIKELNKAILKENYGLKFWELPDDFLCPPIPGRADYIHYAADLLANSNKGKIPLGEKVACLDIGVGANCIYPIIGHGEYGWSFIGADTDSDAIRFANSIVENNPDLKDKIELVEQKQSRDFFFGVISKESKIALSVCNPPFYTSAKEARAATSKKLRNLSNNDKIEYTRNYGGRVSELCYPGGEVKFISLMIKESKKFAGTCLWFTSLVSRKESLPRIMKELNKIGAVEIKTVNMSQGNKVSRFVAWTYIPKEKHCEFIDEMQKNRS